MLLKLATAALFASMCALTAAPISVLWWDSTPEYSAQAPDAFRQEMSDYLTAFGGGGVFSSTYVGSETPGTLAAHLAANAYDVIVFDATSSGPKFNADDLLAVQNHYLDNRNLLFDGTLYIRNIVFGATTDFPGVNGDTGRLTANEIYQLGIRGGGIMVGTDHEGFQTDADQIVGAILPGAAFTGITTPSTDGQWNGTDLLQTLIGSVVPVNILNHWDEVPTEGIAPTGVFLDFLGNSITLYSQVDVADKPGGGPKFSYISTSWEPGGRVIEVTDPNDPGDPNGGEVPEPATYAMVASGLLAAAYFRRRR